MQLPENFSGFPEPNYTKTPNLIFDALLPGLSGSQLKVLLFIVRRTMGWNKAHEFIPVSVLEIQGGTGLSKEPVVDALQYLREMKLILRKKQRDTSGRASATAYRIRFDGEMDSDEEQEIPKSENPTLVLKHKGNNEPKVGLVETFPTLEGGAYNNVLKEIERTKQVLPIVPLENLSLDLEDDIITFVQNVYKRENRRAKLDNLRTRAHERTCESIRRGESEWSAEVFRAALHAYLHDQSEWLREHGWPINVFLKQVAKFVPDSPQTPRQSSPAAASSIAAPSEVVSLPSGSAARLESGVALPQIPNTSDSLPFAAAEWNRVVTAGPAVEQWTRRDKGLDAAVADADFVSALPKVLLACQQAFVAKSPEEVDWLNFRWLLKRKGDQPENWYRIASGEMNWLRHKRADANSSPVRKPAALVMAENYLAKLKTENAARRAAATAAPLEAQ